MAVKMRMLTSGDKDIRIAAEAIKAGRLAAFPTETVYGLGGDAFNVSALARIFEAKRRPRFDPLIVHIADLSTLNMAADVGSLPRSLRAKLDVLCRNLWPGPLTLVLPKQASVPDLATSGLPTVAARFPSHPVAQKLIRYSTGAIAAPSANPFGYLSPTKASHVQEQLGELVDFIIDGGRAGIGVESTVLDLTEEPARMLRPGGAPREAIEAIIGHVETGSPPAPHSAPQAAPHSPGQLASHYAPKTPLFLHDANAMLGLSFCPDEAYLFFDEETRGAWNMRNMPNVFGADGDGRIFTLTHGADKGTADKTLEAAANLFDILHIIDNAKPSAIHAQKSPDIGLGAAINDRLTRAAAKRN
ncbi:MAG: threonylcarbamoyl-AMP synthase [Treponema sp.]|nr:threonylcarbamoyl-AMP synthase [Treponema sp.]